MPSRAPGAPASLRTPRILKGGRTTGPPPIAATPPLPARRQLDAFIAKYSREIAAEGRAALEKLRRLVPGAVELVYDNYNWLVVGFCPSERASDAVLSLVFAPRWLSVCFLQDGPELPDPSGLLRGTGKVVRNVRLQSAKDLDTPAVRALIAEALARADVPIDGTRRGRLVIKSISAKQRSRRPGAASRVI